MELSGNLPDAWGQHGSFTQLTELYLDHTDITGQLPSTWAHPGSFPALAVFFADATQLTGKLPPAWGGLGSFPSLVRLHLGSNGLTGALPPEWGSQAAFQQLTHLLIANTSITGTIPSNWGFPGTFLALQAFEILAAQITGTLPAFWGTNGSFPALIFLHLDSCPLSGTLSADWGSPRAFPQLAGLSITNCSLSDGISHLSGTLPYEWGNAAAFQQVKTLAIANCNITGSIPASWGSIGAFPSLETLYLYDMPLTGILPPSWGSNGSLPELGFLRVGTGHHDFSCLSGTLPADWGSPVAFQQLQKLDIAACMTGTVPNEWGSPDSFPALTHLSLHITNLSGSLPMSWGLDTAFPALQVLQAGSGVADKNFLSGTLPTEWGSSSTFQNLEFLELLNCTIHGPLPSSWGNPEAFPSLISLTLFDMALTGPLPASWARNGSFPSLQSVGLGADLAGPRLACMSGPMPASWGSPSAFQLLEILTLRICAESNVPSTWGQPGAFPALQFLDIKSCNLTGTLPSSWPPALQYLNVADNSFHGPLPMALSRLTQLQQLTLDDNRCTGQLPAQWGLPGVFPELYSLQIVNAHLTGSLPDSWGNPTAFSSLQTLVLRGIQNLTGTLPESWAGDGAFPQLLSLGLEGTGFTGTFPLSWASQDAFPQLQVLDLKDTRLHGALPSFNNNALKGVLVENCYFNSTLDAIWASSAPLEILSLSYNFISGSLPDKRDALSGLTFLDVNHNQMQGTLPLSWLQPGNLMPHISVLNVGHVWEASQAHTDWKQQLCLKKALYDTDITGQRAAILPALKQSLSAFADHTITASVYNMGYSSWLQSGDALILETLSGLVQVTDNQLTSVKDICANRGSDRVLLIVWLMFVASALVIVAIYAFQCWFRHKEGFKQCKMCLSFPALQASFVALYETFYGLGGLVFYYYDLVTSVIVLGQVWRTWPGDILFAIFLFHFAITGVLVAFRLVFRFVDMSQAALGLHVALVASSLVAGPFMIPVVLLLDTCAFVRQVLLCCQRLIKLLRLHWARPGFLVAFSIHRYLHNLNYLGFSWIDLEGYEGMHNLVGAFLQSLPTVVLYSVLFALGNKPSHGVFLTDGLFVVAIVASCLAILKCLVVILWQAYKEKSSALNHLARIAAGDTLVGNRNEAAPATQLNGVDKLVQSYYRSGSGPLGCAQSSSC
ncbi:hypothetical protein ABBQ38_007402 [Trebouxia sp. C0009 RCD-2024]